MKFSQTPNVVGYFNEIAWFKAQSDSKLWGFFCVSYIFAIVCFQCGGLRNYTKCFPKYKGENLHIQNSPKQIPG